MPIEHSGGTGKNLFRRCVEALETGVFEMIYRDTLCRWVMQNQKTDTEAMRSIIALAAALEFAVLKAYPGVCDQSVKEDIAQFLLLETITYRRFMVVLPESILHIIMTQCLDASVFDMVARTFAERVLKYRKSTDRKLFADAVMHMFLLYLEVSA